MIKLLILLVSTFNIILIQPSHGNKIHPKEDKAIALSDSFNDGWKVGWKAGWRQVNGQYSYPPYPPFPPFPKYGQNDFQGGYNAGFLAGIEAAGGLQ